MMPSRPNALSWPAYARRIIEYTACHGDPSRAEPPQAESRPHGGVFVTLHKFGKLRGCMGILDPDVPLAEAVRQAAVSAASQDPRFSRVVPDELPDLEIEVSVLSDSTPMRSLEDLKIGRHGILVRQGLRRGLFLPQVAVDHHLDKEQFLSRCCSEKAGLPADAWRDPKTEVLLFTTEVAREA